MKEFLLLIQGHDPNASPELMQERMQDYMTWMQEMTKEGAYVAGQPLEPTGYHLPNTEDVITDGPYLEPKEVIAGYIIIKASDIDAATTIAKNCPLLTHCQIYVRPLVTLPG